ncbi:MAG TPA: hypothetical protein VNF71_14440 [Acidimicrobiales bacterium]|nr:hypothetical protein [Acidimicrobiales bacterium]
MSNTATVTVTGTVGQAGSGVLLTRSIDGGITWGPVRAMGGAPAGFTGVLGGTGLLTYIDTEAIAGAIGIGTLPPSLTYAARLSPTTGSVSGPGVSAAVNPIVSTWSLVTATPGQTAAVGIMVMAHEQTRPNREALHLRLGATYPIVVTDVVGARAGTLTCLTTTQSAFNAVLGLLGQLEVLFLVSPYGDILYLVADPAGTTVDIQPGGAAAPYRTIKFGYSEVAAP